MKYFSFLVFILMMAGSCNLIPGRIKGNGKIVTKNFALNNFDKIDIGGSKNIILTQDSAFSVNIQTDENLFSDLEAYVENGELNVDSKNDKRLNPSDKISVNVSMPVLKKIDISGISTFSTNGKFSQNEKISVILSGASEGTMNLRAPELNLKVVGASALNISGETRNVISTASGSSVINSFDLKSETTDTKASGASSVNVFASIELKAKASGASNISYKGNPTVQKKSTGASEVTKAD